MEEEGNGVKEASPPGTTRNNWKRGCTNLQVVRRRRSAGTVPLMAPRAFTVRGVYKTEELGQGLGSTIGGNLGIRAPPIDIGRLQTLGAAYRFIAAWKAVRHVPIPLSRWRGSREGRCSKSVPSPLLRARRCRACSLSFRGQRCAAPSSTRMQVLFDGLA